MKRLLPLLALLLGCPGEPVDDNPLAGDAERIAANVADDHAFVRRAVPLLWGRAPRNEAEHRVFVDLVAELGRADFVRRLARDARYDAHWQPLLYDLTGVSRLGYRANRACYDASEGVTGTELAEWIRDRDPTRSFDRPWTMLDLARSTLELDDLSAWMLGDLFASVVVDADAMNMAEAESTRNNLATAVLSNYLNRELSCLPCHNSSYSVTGNPDPLIDRTWEVPGLYERALFGLDGGMELGSMGVLMRRDGVSTGPIEVLPEEPIEDWEPFLVTAWGAVDACGTFAIPDHVHPDRLGWAGYFAGELGPTGSVWDVHAVFAEGFAELRGQGAPAEDAGEVSGPHAAARLATLRLAEALWAHAFGTELTISHNFPRTQAQRDKMVGLAATLSSSGYSLVEGLVAVATDPYFVQAAPVDLDDAAAPTFYDPVFDPWTIDLDEDLLNGPGDALRRRPVRELLQVAIAALEWTDFPAFPIPLDPAFENTQYVEYGPEAHLQKELGLPMKQTTPGTRSVDFQSLLVWESLFGGCRNPYYEEGDDVIDRILAEDGTVADALGTLKDRLLGDASIDGEEQQVLQAVLGEVGFDEALTGSEEQEEAVRVVCGVWLSSPQFQLGGDPGEPGAPAPAPLSVDGDYRERCEELSDRLFDGGLTCGDDSLSL